MPCERLNTHTAAAGPPRPTPIPERTAAGRPVQKVYEVFSCRNGEWIMAGSTPDRSYAESLFNEALKDKACQGARLVEEGIDPKTGDMRDRVIQKRDKAENLPYFNPRKASEAAAAAKRAAARLAPIAGAAQKPGAPGGAPPAGVTAEELEAVATSALRETSSGMARWMTMNLIGIGIPTAIFIAHERFVGLVGTEIALAACLALMILLLVVLNRQALTAEKTPATVKVKRPIAAPPPRRKRMKVTGILGQKKPEPTPDPSDEAEDKANAVEETTRALLQLLQKSLEVLAGDGRFVKGGRLNQMDVFGCHLFCAGAVEASLPGGEDGRNDRDAALRTMLSVLTHDARMVDWFLGNLGANRADEKAARMMQRSAEAGRLWTAKNAGAPAKLLAALVAWNAPDPNGAPTLTLVHASLPPNAAANLEADRLALARVRAAVAAHGGREHLATDRTIIATFVAPRGAVAAAAEIQVGNEADRAGNPDMPRLRLAVHGKAGLALGDTEGMTRAVETTTHLSTRFADGTVILSGPVARAMDGIYGLEPLGSLEGNGWTEEAHALGDPIRPDDGLPGADMADAASDDERLDEPDAPSAAETAETGSQAEGGTQPRTETAA